MTYIKHFMYKCTTRLLSLIVTFNTIGMPGSCEAYANKVPASSGSFPTLLAASAASAAAAAATTYYKSLHRKKIENAAITNPVVQNNPYNVKEVSASENKVGSSLSTVEITKPLTSEIRKSKDVVTINPVVQNNPYNAKEVSASENRVGLSLSTVEITKPLTSEIRKSKDLVTINPVVKDNSYNVIEINIASVPVSLPSTIEVTKSATSSENDIRPIASSDKSNSQSQPKVASSESNANPKIIVSNESDIAPKISSNGNNTPSDNITVGSDSNKGNMLESDSANLVATSPSSTQNFLKGILDFHSYTTSQLHQSLKNRVNVQVVASGDESQKLEIGLWAQGILGNAVERKSASSSGYKGRFHGFTIGADTEFNDNGLVGVAFSNIISSIKFKDQYSGDKTSINTKAASLYGKKDLTNKVYVSGTASLTQSSTNASYLATNTQGQQFYKYQEKKNIKGGFVEARLHYVNALRNDMVLTPFLGVSYSKSALPGFSGIDSTGLPFAIASLKSEYTNVTVGTSLSLPSYSANKLEIMPKINASVDQRIYSKVGSVQITDSNGNPVTVKNSDKNKTTLNLGGSMDLAYKNTDFLVAYDTQIKNKFLGQQVALKVRVNL